MNVGLYFSMAIATGVLGGRLFGPPGAVIGAMIISLFLALIGV